jgi:hypothetical protein
MNLLNVYRNTFIIIHHLQTLKSKPSKKVRDSFNRLHIITLQKLKPYYSTEVVQTFKVLDGKQMHLYEYVSSSGTRGRVLFMEL